MIQNEFSQGTNSTHKVCFIFTILSNLSIVQFKTPINFFFFHFSHFHFAYNFVVLQKVPPSQLFSGAIPLSGTNRTIIRGSNLKRHKPPFWISVNLRDTFRTQKKQKKHSFCVAISRREKDGAQSIIPCMVCLIMVDMSFSENTDDFFWILQNLGARSCLKGSLVAPTWSHIMF